MNGRPGRYHPILILRSLRKTLALYLLPLIRVLFERDWPAVRTALRQDLALFAFLSVFSWVLLRVSGWELDNGALRLHWDLFFRLERTIRPGAAAALTIERPLLFRLMGASRVTLYLTGEKRDRKVTLCLSRRDADALADQLLPADRAKYRHTFTGGEKLALALLGANFLSTLALLALALRESRQFPTDAHTLAFAQLSQAAAFAERWLPAGLAWLLVLTVAVSGASILRSAAQTARYTVWRTPELVCSRGGLVRRYEYRIRTAQISFADLRLSPGALLMRRRPVFVTVAGFADELPLFVCRTGRETMLDALLPGFQMPPRGRVDIRRRSLVFFAPAGVPLAVCLLLAAVASYTLPALTIPLLAGAGIALVFLAAAAAGYLREGAWVRGGRLTLCRQHGLHLHCLCVFHPDTALLLRQSPWAAAACRANLTFAFPGRVHRTVRSIPLADAEACMEAGERG